MRWNVYRFVENVDKCLCLEEPIVEIGSMTMERQNSMIIKNIFKNRKYIACDMRNGKNVDRIENVENLSFKNNSVGTVLMLDTLEHVENIFKAFDEIYRVLKPSGCVIFASAMNFPIHGAPCDYWRFTPDAFKYLTRKFPIKIIGYQGQEKFPHTVYGISFKTKNNEVIKNYKKFTRIQKNLNKPIFRQIMHNLYLSYKSLLLKENLKFRLLR